jgi:hypothetical protein
VPSLLTQGGWCYVHPEISQATASLHVPFQLGVPITNAGDEASTSSSYVTLHMTNDRTQETVERHLQPPHDLAPGDTGHTVVDFGAGEMATGRWNIIVYGEGNTGGNPDYHGSAIDVEDDRSVDAS